VRQYVKVLERPDVDVVTGLPPSVAIEQRSSRASRRSTVATLTEIYHFMRLLFSKLGVQHCPGCGRPMTAQDRESIIARIQGRYKDRSGLLLAPKVMGRKGFHKDLLAKALRRGYREARIDGTFTVLEEGVALSRYHEHTIEIVVGRVPAPDAKPLVARALEEGEGSVVTERKRSSVSGGFVRDAGWDSRSWIPVCSHTTAGREHVPAVTGWEGGETGILPAPIPARPARGVGCGRKHWRSRYLAIPSGILSNSPFLDLPLWWMNSDLGLRNDQSPIPYCPRSAPVFH
jgi:excinuclease UvrABC ATPase subunit